MESLIFNKKFFHWDEAYIKAIRTGIWRPPLLHLRNNQHVKNVPYIVPYKKMASKYQCSDTSWTNKTFVQQWRYCAKNIELLSLPRCFVFFPLFFNLFIFLPSHKKISERNKSVYEFPWRQTNLIMRLVWLSENWNYRRNSSLRIRSYL